MMTWEKLADEPDRFGYRTTGRSTGTGCLLVFMGLITGFFLLVGIGLVLGAEDWGLRGMGLFAGIIGAVGIYSAIAHWKRDYRVTIFFDRRTEEFHLQAALTKQEPFVVSYDRFDRLHMYRTYRSSSGSDSTTRYKIYILALVLKDGSELDLESGGDATAIAELARQLAEFTGLGVTSQAELELTIPATRNYAAGESAGRGFAATATASSSVRESATPEGREFRLNTTQMTTGAKIINVLVLALFLAVPMFIFMQADVIFFQIFAGLFVIMFYSVIALVVLMQLRRFAVVLNRSRLLVRIEFPVPGVSAFNQEIEIPATQIEAVQINLSEEGHFWLALCVGADFELPTVSQFLANVGPYAKGIRTGPDDERRLSLWEINAFQPPGAKGASTADLEYIAATIREEIGLRAADGRSAS
ncbi:MAG: hypothetical protein NXI24_13425 [bacterium]|nr:hypothetical protein [bacterium]